MRILGVDPGLQVTGYGVISVPKNFSEEFEWKVIEAGVIRSAPHMGIVARLVRIYNCLGEVVAELRPDVLVMEKLFAHYRHPATAILMGHVRGAVCLLSGVSKVPLVSMPSTRVKKAVTGKGHAGKWQIQRMVQHTLRLKKLPDPPDVADALALAITYAASLKKALGAAGLKR